MNESGVRKQRLAGAIRKHLSAELAREVADPRLFSLAVSAVNLTADLGLATVKVRLMFGGEDTEARQIVMTTLDRIAPGLRASLATVLKMRRVPALRFYYDEAVDINAEIEGVLRDIERENTAKKRELEERESSPPSSESDDDAQP